MLEIATRCEKSRQKTIITMKKKNQTKKQEEEVKYFRLCIWQSREE